MRVYHRKPRKNEHVAFSFGAMQAELSGEIIKQYRLGPALKRFGLALAKQYAHLRTRDGNDPVIGVDLLRVEFSFLFGENEPREKGGA